MPIKDVVIAALSRPAARVVEAPVRELIDQALADRGYASPAEIAQLRDELRALKGQLEALPGKVGALEGQLARLTEESAALRAAVQRAELASGESRAQAAEAEARAAEAEARLSALEQSLASRPATNEAAPAPAAACKVEACARAGVEKGFCRPHLLSWKAGRLAGFVSPEGLVDLGGAPARVALTLAGRPYAADRGKVRVDGKIAASHAL